MGSHGFAGCGAAAATPACVAITAPATKPASRRRRPFFITYTRPRMSAQRRRLGIIGSLRLTAVLLQLIQRLRQSLGRELDLLRLAWRLCRRSGRPGDGDV